MECLLHPKLSFDGGSHWGEFYFYTLRMCSRSEVGTCNSSNRSYQTHEMASHGSHLKSRGVHKGYIILRALRSSKLVKPCNYSIRPILFLLVSSYHTPKQKKTLPINHTPHLSILLLNIGLRTPLLRLPNIMLLLRLQLCLPITRNTSNGTSNSTRDAVCDAGAEVVELALCFLAFAFGVLLGACALEILLFCVSKSSFLSMTF